MKFWFQPLCIHFHRKFGLLILSSKSNANKKNELVRCPVAVSGDQIQTSRKRRDHYLISGSETNWNPVVVIKYRNRFGNGNRILESDSDAGICRNLQEFNRNRKPEPMSEIHFQNSRKICRIRSFPAVRLQSGSS